PAADRLFSPPQSAGVPAPALVPPASASGLHRKPRTRRSVHTCPQTTKSNTTAAGFQMETQPADHSTLRRCHGLLSPADMLRALTLQTAALFDPSPSRLNSRLLIGSEKQPRFHGEHSVRRILQ